jgi:hypothetical protein
MGAWRLLVLLTACVTVLLLLVLRTDDVWGQNLSISITVPLLSQTQRIPGSDEISGPCQRIRTTP